MKKAILLSFIFTFFALTLAYFELIPGISKEAIFRYYFLDYIGIMFILVGQSLLKGKNKIAFLFYVIGLISNAGMGYFMESYVVIMFSFLSIWIFIQNWIQWNKDEKIKHY